jgi:cystathionine beta-lyase/cystathionine gamma-synthase
MRIDPVDVAACVSDPIPDSPTDATPASAPIVQTSLFTFPTFQALLDGLGAEHRHHVYSRGQNPTVEAVEAKLTTLERGEACKCFASGMAAISAVLLGLLRSGDHVLFVNQVYGPALQLASHLRRFGIEHDVLLDVSPDAVSKAMRPGTRLLWLESPGTMLFRVLDIGAIAELARERGALTCVDNSWATPLCQKPLTLGADIVVHSGTKYLGGHSDLLAGAVISSAERMEEIFYRAFMLNGGILAPFDAWLLLRGLRTLPVRLQQHEADGLRVAEFLADHPAVRRVFHPEFSEQSELVTRQLRGYSGLLSFELVRDDIESISQVIDTLRHFRIGVSWGGVESLVLSPNRGTNAAQLEAQGIPPGLIRLSVGLEGADLLIDDLRAALAAVR